MTCRGIACFMVLAALISLSGMMKLGLAPHQLLVKWCQWVLFLENMETWCTDFSSPSQWWMHCSDLPIQKDGSEGGGITWIFNGCVDEIGGAVQPTCQLTWSGWELTLISQGCPQPRWIPNSHAMQGGMGSWRRGKCTSLKLIIA